MSSRVNIGQLVDFINSLPETLLTLLDWPRKEVPFFDPNLMFKFLYCGAPSTARPPISSHISKCFFSFDVSIEELKKIGRRSLRRKVNSAFEDKVSAYADLLKPTTLPEDVLYFILPYIYGGEDCLTGEMLAQIVATAKKLLAEASPSRTRAVSSFKRSRKNR